MRIVLDTSVFTNPDTGAQFGPSVPEAFTRFVDQAREVEGVLQFYMPPSVWTELQHFLGDAELPADFERWLALQGPERFNVSVPGHLLYELIDDVRTRIDRGLRLAEQAVREVREASGDEIIRRLREKYRQALRTGLIDSREDVDLVLLAKELGAAISSADRGVVTWAEKLGIRLVRPHGLAALMAKAATPDEPRPTDMIEG